MKNSQLYPTLGFLIGWGSPLGALMLRYIAHPEPLSPYGFVAREWESNSFFYWYMLVGTCLVFTWIGVILGSHADREKEKHLERIGS